MNDHSPEVVAFTRRAREFTEWCEAPHAGKASDQLRFEALRQLAEIYAAGHSLPRAQPTESPTVPPIAKEERTRLAANLAALPIQYYWDVLAPSDLHKDAELGCGDLLDDFLDIHGDLTAGLWLFEHGHAASAVFEWALRFRAHWGHHAVSAMHALHSLEILKPQVP